MNRCVVEFEWGEDNRGVRVVIDGKQVAYAPQVLLKELVVEYVAENEFGEEFKWDWYESLRGDDGEAD